MAEDQESGSGHHDPAAEDHIQSDRQNSQNFFEGRHIDHHIGEGTETPGPVRRLINRFYELRGKRKESRQLPSNETARRFADKMNSGSTAEPSSDLDASEHAQLRKGPRSEDVRLDLNLRTHHELSAALGKKYFDVDDKSEPGTDETPKPSKE